MDSLESGEYLYKPLSHEREIRVLVLQPGRMGDLLHCDLKHVSLADPPPYEALSYVWGDASDKDQIQCGDGTLAVTTNLRIALSYLRAEEVERVIWADAICINQDDLDERGLQVQLMAQIYSSACRTLVWLGEETEEVQQSFRAMETILDHLPVMRVDGGNLKVDPKFTTDDDLARMKRDSDNWGWEHLKTLLQQPWFQRKWVIQEIAVSRNIIVCCGYSSLPWQTFEDIASCCLNLKLDVTEIRLDKVATTVMDNIIWMSALRYTKLTLSELMFGTRKFLCTDPRDHVYALLGLASDIKTSYTGLIVDYTADIKMVLYRLCMCNIKEDGSLRFLSLGYQANYESSSLPSWMPDVLNPNYLGIHPDTFDFAATGDSVLKAEIDQGGQTFKIMGRTIDEVKTLSLPFEIAADVISQLKLQEDTRLPVKEDNQIEKISGSNDEPANNPDPNDLAVIEFGEVAEWYKEWYRSCKQIAWPLDDMPVSTERLNQFYRTLLWDSSLDTMSGSVHLGPEKYPLIAEFLSNADDYSSWFSQDNEWWDRFSFLFQEVEVPITRVFEGRRFCSTASGHLGSMPRNAKPGDIVCAFYGGDLLYVLRPCGEGRHQFIGDCYLDGFMRGEAMKLDVETQEFVLV